MPDLLASTDPGDLFTMRNVGKLVPPATSDGVSIGDLSEASAIEFSVLVLKVANIVVCGHSGCGAMKAVLRPDRKLHTPNLDKWLHHAHPAAVRLKQEGALNPALALHDQLSQLNVLVQVDHLMSYPIARKKVAARTLQLSGWWFDIATRVMHAYERSSRSFRIFDRQFATHLTDRRRASRQSPVIA